jgi:hypothetical protein
MIPADTTASLIAGAMHDVIGVLPADVLPSLTGSSPGHSHFSAHLCRAGEGPVELIEQDKEKSEDRKDARSHRKTLIAHSEKARTNSLVLQRKPILSQTRARSVAAAAAFRKLSSQIISTAQRALPRALRSRSAVASSGRRIETASSAMTEPLSVAGAASMVYPLRPASMRSVPVAVPPVSISTTWHRTVRDGDHIAAELNHEAIDAIYRLGAFIVHCCDIGSGHAPLPHRHAGGTVGPSLNSLDPAVDDLCRRLLPFLAWVPFRVFSVPVMECAVEVWQWVLGACPFLRVTLLGHIAAAWSWSISMRFGLFSGSTRISVDRDAESEAGAGASKPLAASSVPADFISPPDPESGSEHVARATLGGVATLTPVQWLPAGLADHEPHRAVIQFFEERCRMSRASSGEELAVLIAAVSAAVSDSSRLSHSPAAFGTYVRLMHVGYHVLHCVQSSDSRLQQKVKSQQGLPVVRIAQPSPSTAASTLPLLGMVGASLGEETGGSYSSHQSGGRPSGSHSARITGHTDNVGLSELLKGDDSDAASLRTETSGPAQADTDPFVTSNGDAVDGPEASLKHVSNEQWPSVRAGSVGALRERLYRTTLALFARPLSHYEVATSPAVVRDDFPYITGLCRLVQSDARLWNSGVNVSGNGPRDSVFASSSAAAALVDGDSIKVHSTPSWSDTSLLSGGVAPSASVNPVTQGSAPLRTKAPTAGGHGGLRKAVLQRMAANSGGSGPFVALAFESGSTTSRRVSSVTGSASPRMSRGHASSTGSNSADRGASLSAAASAHANFLAQQHFAQGAALRGMADLVLVRRPHIL